MRNALIVLNRTLTTIGYIAYPVLLLVLFLSKSDKLLEAIIVPFVGFVVVSVFRYLVNSARPYEQMDIDPLIKKDTKGKSFPSRHTFCMFMIAFAWMLESVIIGIILFIAACILGYLRVVGGVHYPKDVIAAFIAATIVSSIGYVFMSW